MRVRPILPFTNRPSYKLPSAIRAERSGPISWELARDATMLFYVEHREANLGRMEKLLLFWRAANGRGEANNPPQLGNWPVAQQLESLLLWLNVRPAGRGRRRRVP